MMDKKKTTSKYAVGGMTGQTDRKKVETGKPKGVRGGMNAGKAEAIGAAALSMLGGSKPKKPTKRTSPKAIGKITGRMMGIANKMFKGMGK